MEHEIGVARIASRIQSAKLLPPSCTEVFGFQRGLVAEQVLAQLSPHCILCSGRCLKVAISVDLLPLDW